MGTHNWDIVPFLESASFKEKLCTEQQSITITFSFKVSITITQKFIINYISIKLKLLQPCLRTSLFNYVTIFSAWSPGPDINPQMPDGVYKPPLVYCRMGFINTSPFPALHLSRNATKVSESLKISDQRMAKPYSAVFIHEQPLEGFQTLIMPPLASLSPLCRARFQVVASSRKMETKGK